MAVEGKGYCVLKWTLIFLSVFTSSAWGFFRFMRNYETLTGGTNPYNDSIFWSEISVAAVQTFSFSILIYSICRIRNFLKRQGLEHQINSKMICLHGVCVGAYLSANMMLILLFTIAGNDSMKHKHAIVTTLVWILVCLCQFITQISLIMIFWEIGKENPLKKYKD